MAENRSQRTKLTLKDLGDPGRVKTMDAAQLKEAGNKYVCGILIGIAAKFINRRDDKTGETFEGLGGEFRMVPADGGEQLESGILFIPDAFHNMVAAAVRKAQDKDPNAKVKFAFQVASIPAKNPAGYSWDFKPVGDADGENPLDALAGEIVKHLPAKQKALMLTQQK